MTDQKLYTRYSANHPFANNTAMAMNNYPNKPTFNWDEGIKRYEEARDFMGDNAFTEAADKIAKGRKIGKQIRKNRMVRKAKRTAKKVMKGPKMQGR